MEVSVMVISTKNYM